MRDLVIGSIDALIPLGVAFLLLLFPQWFTKKDLKIDENQALAKRLRMAGWLLVVAGMLILIANLGKTFASK